MMFKKEKKKENVVYQRYLRDGVVMTQWMGHWYDTTGGEPPTPPMPEDEIMALSARKPTTPKRYVQWDDEARETVIQLRSETAHKRFLELGPEKFFGVAPSAKAVMAKINGKQRQSKAYQPFKKLTRPDMAAKEKQWRDAQRVTRRMLGEGDE